MGGNGTATPRSLADDLRERSDTELAVLLRARPDLVNPVPVDIAQLAARATTRASILRAIDRLDRFSLHVVDAIAVLPEPVTPVAIGNLVGAPPSAVDHAVDALRTAAIVWGSDDDLRMVRAVHEIVGPYPAGLGPPLRQALTTLSPGRLAQLAADLGLDSAGDPSVDAHALADVIVDGLDHTLADLSAEATEVLRMLAEGPPTGRVDDAQREVGIATARTPIDSLLARGLLVPVDATTVVLPREIGLRLRGGLLRPGVESESPEPAGVTRDTSVVDRTAAAGALEAIRRIEAVLDAWSAEPPTVLRAGGLGVRDLRRTAQGLDADEADAGIACGPRLRRRIGRTEHRLRPGLARDSDVGRLAPARTRRSLGHGRQDLADDEPGGRADRKQGRTGSAGLGLEPRPQPSARCRGQEAGARHSRQAAIRYSTGGGRRRCGGPMGPPAPRAVVFVTTWSAGRFERRRCSDSPGMVRSPATFGRSSTGEPTPPLPCSPRRSRSRSTTS